MPSIFQGIVQNIRCTREQLGPHRVPTDWDKRGTFSILFGQSMFEASTFFIRQAEIHCVALAYTFYYILRLF